MTLLETLRVRIGLASIDTSKDTEILLAKDTTFSLMGNYCDRIFTSDPAAIEEFTHLFGTSIPLKRYPINSIDSIVDDKGREFTLYHEDVDTGVIHLDYSWAFHQVTVTFSGGYDEDALPTDLLMAFYSIFDKEYAFVEGGTVSDSGEIQSISVVDVGTIRYRNPDSNSSVGAFLPDRAKSILDDYMRYKC